MPLSAMLHELARDAARQAALKSERDAARADAGNPAVDREERDWAIAVGDGIV